MQLTRATLGKTQNLFNGDQTTFIDIIEVSELVVKDTGEDVRCHLYGGKTQT